MAAPAGALGTSEEDGLWLHCRPRINGEAPVIMLICWWSRVGVVSGMGDFTRRLPGVKDGGADNGDDLLG